MALVLSCRFFIKSRMKMTEFPSDYTLIIKTFERPAVLQRLLDSIQLHYPDIPIILSDDSRVHAKPKTRNPLIHQKHEFDIGLSEGRNRAVNAVMTPFVITLDDDFVCQHNSFDAMLYGIRRYKSEVIGGRIEPSEVRHGLFSTYKDANGNYATNLNFQNHRMQTYHLNGREYIISHSMMNFFVAQTQVLRENPWPSEIKISEEHWAFFYRLRRAGVKCALTSQSSVEHRCPEHRGLYRKKRVGRKSEYLVAGLDAMGVCEFTKQRDGEVWQLFAHPEKRFDWATAERVEELPL